MGLQLFFPLAITACGLYLLYNAILGFTRFRRVYKGLQADVYPPAKGKGEPFAWRAGPKTAREALRALGGDIFFVALWVLPMTNSGYWAWASITTKILAITGVLIFSVFAILDCRKWLRLKRGSGVQQSPHPSGGAM